MENKTVFLSTGNPIVDEMSTISISGNVIPEIWYKTLVNEKNRTNPLAILILADIVYWYRPTEKRDEVTNKVFYIKRFADDDYLQRSYDQLSQKFCISKNQARDAILFLEDKGVIKRHFRTVQTLNGPLPNVMYIELIPAVLKKLTFPDNDEGGIQKKIDTPLDNYSDPSAKKETPPNKKADTNTEITPENTPENTTGTTTTIVVALQSVFKGLNLEDKDLIAIAQASHNDVAKCKKARQILDQQSKPIWNITGWLIKAITEDYNSPSKSPAHPKSTFNNFEQRDYDFDELARLLVCN